jgi:hypothetical protein
MKGISAVAAKQHFKQSFDEIITAIGNHLKNNKTLANFSFKIKGSLQVLKLPKIPLGGLAMHSVEKVLKPFYNGKRDLDLKKLGITLPKV